MSISDFADMMPHTITLEEFAQRDAYGKPSYGSAVNYSARVSYKSKFIRRADGSEVLAQGEVWILGTPTVTVEDRITLPDGNTPVILMTELLSDELGSHHSKVIFG